MSLKIYSKHVRLTLFTMLFFHLLVHAQVYGCTDAAANNYNASATINDGSCTYDNASVKASLNTKLNMQLNETSGLLFFSKWVITHNDSGGQPELYTINTATGAITKTISITNATNKDWEDIAQDDKYIYIGDFGNNASGNRTDLKIYRVKKSEVKNKTTAAASVINFSYADQIDFSPKNSNSTNYDCEALIAYGDSLFLFSKDWLDNKTRLYKLPKTPGSFIAKSIGQLNVQGLITGAEIITNKRMIVLTGYSPTLKPFVYLLYDFTGNRFFAANKRKIELQQDFLQMEGVCSKTDTQFYISNERSQQIITTPAKLQTINLAAFLNPYYSSLGQPLAAVYSYSKYR